MEKTFSEQLGGERGKYPSKVMEQDEFFFFFNKYKKLIFKVCKDCLQKVLFVLLYFTCNLTFQNIFSLCNYTVLEMISVCLAEKSLAPSQGPLCLPDNAFLNCDESVPELWL